jgi:hypothetical protein
VRFSVAEATGVEAFDSVPIVTGSEMPPPPIFHSARDLCWTGLAVVVRSDGRGCVGVFDIDS